jgi:hypothetical protein
MTKESAAPSSENSVAKREALYKYLTDQFVGPLGGPSEQVSQDPATMYVAGVLFPRSVFKDDEIPEGEAAKRFSDELSSAEAYELAVHATKIRPSSMGISVVVSAGTDELVISISYATYARTSGKYVRQETQQNVPIAELFATKKNVVDWVSPDGLVSVRLIKQKCPQGFRLTCFLVNNTQGKNQTKLFQCAIHMSTTGAASFAPVDASDVGPSHIDDRILRLQFRNVRPYANAFGCSVDWSAPSPGKSVRSTFLPREELLPLTFEISGLERVLEQAFLSTDFETAPGSVLAELAAFSEKYKTWVQSISGRRSEFQDLAAFDEIVRRCKEASDRIDAGIELLKTDGDARTAFKWANLAMLIQAAQYKNVRAPTKSCDITTFFSDIRSIKWRPFQLAFLLLNLEPIVNSSSRFRSVVDLIWFPTGGGKTEAYLGVSAFTILYRRLVKGTRGAGTAVISRYTMRLLTSQQFTRTASLICALELLRQKYESRLGKQRISLGIWLGGDETPNDFPACTTRWEKLLEDPQPKANNPFKLSECPTCHTALVPDTATNDESKFGFKRPSGSRLPVFCLNSDCPMSRGIPVAIVDTEIFDVLPTVVIGTIDKLTRLTWRKSAGALFHGRGEFDPPELILQDELHLISGPLGSLAGVYEPALQLLCEDWGITPRIVASTATVRRAQEQCRALYGREVAVFPPPGVDEDDSWFATKDSTLPGRLYTGLIMPHVDAVTASVRAHAALLQGGITCDLPGINRDAYFTLVSYFNSLRELGQAETMAADDIPKRLVVIEKNALKRRKLPYDNKVSLTGGNSGPELTDILERMSLSWESKRAISILLCTNIISVGVDVDRLSLMLVNGQPKTTSEYIQATSRIGRERSMPGMVVTLYSATKPRDRSIFEHFRSYHSRLYLSVEPTSATPFSQPSRDKALHAALVILARHLRGGIPDNEQAKEIASRPDLQKRIAEKLLEKVAITAPEELNKTNKHIQVLFSEWESWASSGLHYESRNAQQIDSLLHRQINPHPSKRGWYTMDSMRNVDFECDMNLLGCKRP